MRKHDKTDKAIKIAIVSSVLLMIFLIVFLVAQVVLSVKSPYDAAKKDAETGFSQKMSDGTFAEDVAAQSDEINDIADANDAIVHDTLDNLKTVLEEYNGAGGDRK